MTPIVPERLAATCRGTPGRRAWLEQLPTAIRELQDNWSLSLGAPFDGNEVSCAWVAPAACAAGEVYRKSAVSSPRGADGITQAQNRVCEIDTNSNEIDDSR